MATEALPLVYSMSVPSSPTPLQGASNRVGSSQSHQQSPLDLLLLVFIHGFRGNDSTFGDFPSRLEHILSETVQHTLIESIIFPAYQTKGDLNTAVELFSDWLTTLTVEKEVAHLTSGGAAGHVKIVLCGHSMGGLLAADSIYAFIHTRPDATAPLWPNIIACLAFDTPFLGLNPHVFKNSANKVAEYAQGAHQTASGLWDAFRRPIGKSPPPIARLAGLLPAAAPVPAASSGRRRRWGPAAFTVGSALMAGAAAGVAYYHRADIENRYEALHEHMQYVGALWDKGALAERVRHLVEGESTHDIVFRTFYTLLSPTPPVDSTPRTFCLLPESSSDAFERFIPARNTLAKNEVHAHVSMFEPTKNDGYYQLGLEAAAVIRRALEIGAP
ncbi:hypothetical protein F5148DRAFT_1203927 [Russula earlei]|uniref:Uncharacterized protein n=1 Tax=Russula earlei TaxID=71964 RepID=A0ACC0U883_9AGAM|nr:hypothetical protein F5148DRAFT_1203927 [Russula earlei]